MRAFAPLAALSLLMLPFASPVSLAVSSAGNALPISLEGDFSDWDASAVVGTDASGDSGADFLELSIADDGEWLYLRFTTTQELQIDEGQSMRLYLDSDNNSSTGTSYQGIGADLVWDFGSRDGDWRGSFVRHDDFFMQALPTVSDTEFEIGFPLDAMPTGDVMFPGNVVRVILRDMGASDHLPDSGAISYTLSGSTLPVTEVPVARDEAADMRIVAWNLKSDSITSGSTNTKAAIDRMLGALDPDAVVFCENWNGSANAVRDRIEDSVSGNWSAVKLDDGNVIATRFAIAQQWDENDILTGFRNSAVLISQIPGWNTNLLLIANHWRCCTADGNRQMEADAVVAFVRDAMSPGGLIDLPADTPIVMGGDFNLVGLAQQRTTLVTGDIQDNGTFGADSPTDWDGGLLDFMPARQTGARLGYTWRNDNSSFLPGVLDYLFHTGSVIEVGNNFVLDPRTMSSAALTANGLQAGDMPSASDHSPVVLDLRPISVGTAAPFLRSEVDLLPAMPNPFNPSTVLRFRLERSMQVQLRVFDVRGRMLRTLAGGEYPEGLHMVSWDGRDARGDEMASGVYRIELIAADGGSKLRRSETVVLSK